MHLSRLILDLRSRQVRAEIARPYEMHRTLMRAFPTNMQSGIDRVLFRIEPGASDNQIQLLVQSHSMPDWSWLTSKGAPHYLLQPGQRMNEKRANLAIKTYSPLLTQGEAMAFRLVANPTKRLSRSLSRDMEKSKRVGLYRSEEQTEWLIRKGEQHGFQLLGATTSRQERSDDDRNQLKLLRVQFDGVLRVTNPDLLAAAVAEGIGSAKAFGCGLLSLARMQ